MIATLFAAPDGPGIALSVLLVLLLIGLLWWMSFREGPRMRDEAKRLRKSYRDTEKALAAECGWPPRVASGVLDRTEPGVRRQQTRTSVRFAEDIFSDEDRADWRRRIVERVCDELARQDARWGPEHDRAHNAGEWLAILGVQVGQAHAAAVGSGAAFDHVEDLGDTSTADVRHELVQVAAVAIAAVHALSDADHARDFASCADDDEGKAFDDYLRERRGGAPRGEETAPKLTPRAFRDAGYLLYVNRVALHPLGLALTMHESPVDGAMRFGEVLDLRRDPEGIAFTNVPDADAKRQREIDDERRRRAPYRARVLGHTSSGPVQSPKAITRPDGRNAHDDREEE